MAGKWCSRSSKEARQASTTDIDSTEEQYVVATDLHNRIAFPVTNTYDLRSDHYGLKMSYTLDDVVLRRLTSHQERDLDRVVFGPIRRISGLCL